MIDGTLPPEIWAPTEQTEAYERRCLLCGRATETEWLTRRRAALIGVVGISNCSHCGGWRNLELAFGASSSPRAAAPVRTRAQPVRAVPRSLL